MNSFNFKFKFLNLQFFHFNMAQIFSFNSHEIKILM